LSHCGTRKALPALMTAMIYALWACALISPGHCCSHHGHGESEVTGDHDHGRLSDHFAFDGPNPSCLTSLSHEISLSQRHCCGQGLHGEDDRIALHAANCQGANEPTRLVTRLSQSADAVHAQLGCRRTNSALVQASARSPAQESILTFFLLI